MEGVCGQVLCEVVGKVVGGKVSRKGEGAEVARVQQVGTVGK